jgi:hypothetical protein
MGSRAEQRPKLRSTRFLARFKPIATCHVDRISSSPTRRRIVPTAATGMTGPPTLGQHRRGRCRHQADHTVTRYDDRATPHVVPARHQRHPHSTPLHTLGCEHLGRYTQPRIGHRGLATQPSALCTPSSPVGGPLYRPIRMYTQHSAPALQRRMARPSARRRRLPTPPRLGVAMRKQLLQPP